MTPYLVYGWNPETRETYLETTTDTLREALAAARDLSVESRGKQAMIENPDVWPAGDTWSVPAFKEGKQVQGLPTWTLDRDGLLAWFDKAGGEMAVALLRIQGYRYGRGSMGRGLYSHNWDRMLGEWRGDGLCLNTSLLCHLS